MRGPPPDPRFDLARTEFLAGLECFQRARFEAAEQHFLSSLQHLPGRLSTLINLAATQLRLERPQDALVTAEAALAVDPEAAEALLHRATALARLGRANEALEAFDHLLLREPRNALAWSSRGSLLREMQRFDEAALAFRQALEHGADPELHHYYLAALGAADTVPPISPPTYVAGLFDSYADDFDHHLVGTLGYQLPQQLTQGLRRQVAAGETFASALDLGCGTGLCGPGLRPLARRLTGLDLSDRMLDKARALGLYDRLEGCDIAGFLARTDESFDLLLAADVFIYIGDLAPVFAGAQRVMRRGLFSFSVETSAGVVDHVLQPSLRYAHSPDYLRRQALEHGFTVLAMEQVAMRQDQRQQVEGLCVHLRRAADTA